MKSKALKLALIRMAAGLCGGFILGALTGFMKSVGTANSLLFGLFCALSGVLAGAIGHFLFAGPGPTAAVRSILNYAVIGAVFFVSLSLAAPDALAELMGVNGPLSSLVAGLVGGAAGGVTFVIMQGGYTRS